MYIPFDQIGFLNRHPLRIVTCLSLCCAIALLCCPIVAASQDLPRKASAKKQPASVIDESQLVSRIESLLKIAAGRPGPKTYIMGRLKVDPVLKARSDLLSINHPVRIQVFLKAMQYSDPGIRRISAEMLGQVGDSNVIEPLVLALQDKEMWVRTAAAKSLGRIGGPRAVGPLSAAVQHPRGDYDLCRAIAEALANSSDERVVSFLIQALETWPEKWSNRAWNAAESSLLTLRIPSEAKQLVAVLKTENMSVLPIINRALENNKGPEVWDALVSGIDTPDLRYRSASLLIKIDWMSIDGPQQKDYSTAIERANDIWQKYSPIHQCEMPALRVAIEDGNSRLLPDLVQGLMENGDENIANMYLNCGNPTLISAAEKWGGLHGYTVNTRYVSGQSSFVHWGARVSQR